MGTLSQEVRTEVLCGRICDLEAENAKLWELVSLMNERNVLLPCMFGCDPDCRFYGGTCQRIGILMRELGMQDAIRKNRNKNNEEAIC